MDVRHLLCIQRSGDSIKMATGDVVMPPVSAGKKRQLVSRMTNIVGLFPKSLVIVLCDNLKITRTYPSALIQIQGGRER